VTAPVSTAVVTDRGDHDRDVDGDGRRSLSVAEIQQVLRELRTRGSRPAPAEIGAPSQRHEHASPERSAVEGARLPPSQPSTRPKARTPAHDRGDTAEEGRACRGDIAAGIAPRATFSGVPVPGSIAILAAHAGAGATTVALLVTDAAAAQGQQVHLLDPAHPCRSGLVAAASEELGLDVSGAWRRGRRPGVIIDRRATDIDPNDWPETPVGDDAALTVVDVGLAWADSLTGLRLDGVRLVVVVCRPTVPAVRRTEQLLAELAAHSVVVGAVGSRRWPGEVLASLGPRLRTLRGAGRVVTVPVNRRLEIAGLSSAPLPRTLRSAGRSLLQLIEDCAQCAGPASPTAATHPVATPKETHR
jgi:hypothetical protein